MTKKEHKQKQEEFLNILRFKYAKQETNEVLFYPTGIEMTDHEFRDLMVKYFLGDNYCIADDLYGLENTIIAYEIISRN